MTIKRIVNGTEMSFELTESELMHAYYEWQNEIDKEDVQTVLDEMSLSVTGEQLDLIVDTFRDCLSNDDNWLYHAEYAIERILNK